MNTFEECLNQEQLEAVNCLNGPLLILAGAGSGKTRVIVYRIANLIANKINPWNILAMTFTNKAARQMRERISNLVDPRLAGDVWISTYHSFGARILRAEHVAAGLKRDFNIFDDSDSKKLVEICLKEMNLDSDRYKPSVMCDMISIAKDKLLDPESYSLHAAASPESSRRVAAEVYELYQEKLKSMGGVDFGDILRYTVDLFKNNPDVLEKYRERFRYILIDEYQDTNYAQYVLTKLLAAKYKNICVVGDDDQSIYSWRGADIRNILEFERDYPETRVVYLEQNYRSTKNILDTAQKLIHYNHHRKPKDLKAVKPAGDKIEYVEFQNEFAEASGVADRIISGVRHYNRKYSDFAIFYRTNAQSRIFEENFVRAGIPYVVVGGCKFYDRAEVRDILAYLRLINNPSDDVGFRRIINMPPRGIGKSTAAIIINKAHEMRIPLFEALKVLSTEGTVKKADNFLKSISGLHAEKDNMDASEIVKIIIEESGYMEYLEGHKDIESQSRMDNVKELVSAVVDFEQHTGNKTLAAFLENISLVSDIDSFDEKKDYVTLITLHLAKGLEFPCVFITGMEEGLFPLTDSSMSLEEREEERRLCYVGITRAKEELFLSGASCRRIYGQMRYCIPSVFLKEMEICKLLSDVGMTDRDIVSMPRGLEFSGINSSSPYTRGKMIKHPDFGLGKIIDVSGSGDDVKVIVKFDSGFWKKLMVKYAKLEVI